MKIKQKIKDAHELVSSTILPNALQRLISNRIIAAIIIICVCIFASIALKTISFIIGAILSLYLILIAYKLRYDYAKGYIHEYTLSCISTKQTRQNTNVVFLDDNEKNHVFIYPSKKNLFFENVKYTIYTHNQNEKVIIAFEEV